MHPTPTSGKIWPVWRWDMNPHLYMDMISYSRSNPVHKGLEMADEASPVMTSQEEVTSVEKVDGPVKLRLLDAALWKAFNQEGTEMIITKAGRRMFPFVMVTLEGLNPTLLYSVHLQLIPCDNRQYKFCQRRWVSVTDSPSGPAPAPGPAYLHPASPNRGSFWCQEMVSFAKLKITNNKHSQGDIVLQSMRKYMAQIVVREDSGDAEYVFPLPETTFVAVTQYQNETITRMKIAHNPFANGFKYAHVTGSEDTKKYLPRSDFTRSKDAKNKYSSASGTKTALKTTRVKATVTPQTLPSLAVLSPVQPVVDRCAVKLESCDVRLSNTVSFDVAQSEQSQGSDDELSSVAMATTAAFQLQTGEPDFEERKLSKSGAEGQENEPTEDEDEEACDVDPRLVSPDTVAREPPTSSSAPPSSVSKTAGDDRDDENPSEDLPAKDGGDRSVEDREVAVDSPIATADRAGEPLAVTAPLSSAEPTSRESFKAPTSRKATCSKRAQNKSAFGVHAATTGCDVHWYRNAVRQTDEKEDVIQKLDHGVQLTLHDASLWKDFRSRGQELSIGKDGRHMFPVITISLRGLDPGRLYSVWLNLTTADDIFSNIQSGTWSLAYGLQRTPTTVRPYMHPFSPMRGLSWMASKVTFSEVKLTLDSGSEDAASLSLLVNRRYQPQIVVREEEEVTPGSSGSAGDLLFFPLPETTFIAASSQNVKEFGQATAAISPHLQEVRRGKKRSAGTSSSGMRLDYPDDAALPAPKIAHIDPRSLPWNPATALVERTADPMNHRLNNLVCMPAIPALHPAHAGTSPSRLQPTPSMQPMTSYPFHSLFHQVRSPLHSAFGLAVPTFSPLPLLYYPYSVSSMSSLPSPDSSQGLDLSVRASKGAR